MTFTLEVEERIIEHKFWVRLRTGKIVNNCSASRPYYEGRGNFVKLSIPHKDFGHVLIEYSAETVYNAMVNGTPLSV